MKSAAFRLPAPRALALATFCLLPSAFCLSSARAASFTWDGGSNTTNFWSDGPNWAGNTVPAAADTTDIFFGNSARFTSNQNISGTFLLRSITFLAGSNHTTISGQTLRFDSPTLSNPSLTQSSATNVNISAPLDLGGGASFLVGGNGAGTLTLSGVISDVNSSFTTLFKSGSSTLLLTNANTFSGGVTLNGESGPLGVGNDQALGNGGVIVNGNHPFFAVGGARTLANNIALSGAGTLNLVAGPNGVQDLTFNGKIENNGFLNVNLPGGTVTLGGTVANTLNTFNPFQSTVKAGTLALAKQNGVLALSGPLLIGNVFGPGAADSAVVRYDANGQTDADTNVTIFTDGLLNASNRLATIGSLTMTAGEVRLGSGVLTLGGDVATNGNANSAVITSANRLNLGGTSRTFTVADGGALYDLDVQAGIDGGTLVKAGAGLLRLSGTTNAVASFTLTAGSLALGSNAALGSGGSGTLTLAGGSLLADGGDRTVSNPVSVTGNFTLGGSADGTPRAQTFTGPVNVAAGVTLNLNNAAALNFSGPLTLGNGATLTAASPTTTTLSGVVSGAGEILKTNPAGTLALTNTGNTFSGGLTINAGTVNAAGDGSLGAANNVITVNAGRLNFTTAAILTTRTFLLSGAATLSPAPGGSILYFNGASVNGGNLGAGGLHSFQAGSALNGTTTALGSTVTTNGAVTFDNVTLRGTTTVNTNGTLTATNTVVSSPGTLTVNGTLNTAGLGSDGVLRVNAGGTLANTGATLTLGGGSRTFVGTVGTPGGTLSTAAGTSLELNGGLLVNNGTQTGALNVNFGGLAKGAGSFGTVNVTDGGRFSPGNSPGNSSTSGDFTLGAGGRFDFELTSANYTVGDGRADFLAVGGMALANAGTTANSRFVVGLFTLDQSDNPAMLADFNPAQPYTFTLLTAAGGIVGYAANEFTVDAAGFLNATNGGSFSVLQQGDNLVLQFTPVPEPGTWALLLAGCLGWFGAGRLNARRRRRHRQK